jgi:predicted GH43/DUF377 family glycosyl hydrolase
MHLTRHVSNPILVPTQNWWEIRATFNPGAVVFSEKVYLLYRAVGGDNLSRFGIAVSSDGIAFERSTHPVFEGLVLPVFTPRVPLVKKI